MLLWTEDWNSNQDTSSASQHWPAFQKRKGAVNHFWLGISQSFTKADLASLKKPRHSAGDLVVRIAEDGMDKMVKGSMLLVSLFQLA